MDIGAYLRGARERRGLTLEQVARSTKLSTAVLQRIEHNEWTGLPGGLVTRGHLRAFAAEVKVSPEDVVHEYLAQLPPATMPEAPAPQTTSAYPAQPVLLLIAVASIIAGLAAYNWLANRPTPSLAPVSAGVEARPAQESVAPSDAQQARSTPPPPAALDLVIDVTGPCWVSVRADQELAVFRLLESGETVTVAANAQLVLRVGDPSVFHYTVNGAPGRPLGDAGQPVTVTITPATLETFTAASTSTPVPAPPPIAR